MKKDETVASIRKILHALLYEERKKASSLEKAFLYVIRLLTHVGRSIAKDLLPQKASAMAFTTVLSLVPVSALFVLYFKMVGKLDTLSNTLENWILKQFVADAAQNVVVYIDQFVDNLHTKALGTLGAIGLIISAYMLFRTIERSFNDIWRVRMHRSFLKRFQILSSILIIVPAFMIASLYATGKLQESKMFGDFGQLTTAMKTLFIAAPFLLTFVPLFLIFKWVPNTRVIFRSAFIAALFSSFLFEYAKRGFNFYVLHILRANRIYGSLGLLPVTLLWIYVSWLVILLGVELSFVLQNYRALQEEAMEKRKMSPLDVALHEDWGLRILVAMAKRFLNGQGPSTQEDLAQDVGLRVRSIDDHLDILERAKLVGQIEGTTSAGYVFLKPLEDLAVQEIIDLFRDELRLERLVEPKYKVSLLALASLRSKDTSEK